MQGMRYTAPVVSVRSVFGLTLLRRDLSVLPDQNMTLMPTLEQIILIFSLTPLMKGMVVTALVSFIYFILILFWLHCLSYADRCIAIAFEHCGAMFLLTLQGITVTTY